MKDSKKIVIRILLLDIVLLSLIWFGRAGIKRFIVNIGPELLRPPLEFRESDLYRLIGNGGLIIKGEIVDIRADKSWDAVISVEIKSIDESILYKNTGTVDVYMESLDDFIKVGQQGIFLIRKIGKGQYKLCNGCAIEIKPNRVRFNSSLFPASGRWKVSNRDLTLDDLSYYIWDYFRAMYVHWFCIVFFYVSLLDLLIALGYDIKQWGKQRDK